MTKPTMLTIDEVRSKLLELPVRTRAQVTLPLDQALGHHLAEDILARIDTPPFANSAMDGFAVRFADLTAAPLAISSRIAAGNAPTVLTPRTAARIFTGAPIPSGADTVIIQEDCDYNDEHVRILASDITMGDNIRHAGEDLEKGHLIASKGQKLTAPLIAVLASQGIAQVEAFEPLRVALVSTGNELTPLGEPLKPGSIYDSNQHMVRALLQAWGVVDCQHVQLQDSLTATKTTLAQLATNADVIFTFGGVSVGEEDHVKQAVRELGVIESWKVKLKPGKPLMVGKLNTPAAATPILGLPGNPISAFVTYLLFGQTLLNHLSFAAQHSAPSYRLPIGFAVNSPRKRPELLRVRHHHGQLFKNGNQSSGALASLIGCDGLALIPSDICLEEGDMVDFYPMNSLLHG